MQVLATMRFQSSLKPFDWASRIRDSSSNSKWLEVLGHHREAKRAGVVLEDPSLFHLVIKACSNVSFSYGRSLHGYLIKNGFESHTSISNSLMDFYSKSGHLDASLSIVNRLRDRDSISWNIMVFGYLSQGSLGDGLQWFEKARYDGFEPNVSTLVLVIRTCRDLGAKKEVLKLHSYLIRTGFLTIRSVQNSLLSVYAKSDEADCARKLFDEMPERDVISWSVMVKCYVSMGEAENGLKIFIKSVSEVEPDEVTVVSVLKACTCLTDITMGTLVHGLGIRRGLDCDVFLGNSLIDMYSKCGFLDSARKVFNYMAIRNQVSWNSVISGLVLNENHFEALSFFGSMERDRTKPDEITVANVIQICKHFKECLGLRSVHGFALRNGYELNEVVLSSLIDAYVKTGLISYADRTFYTIKHNTSEISWSTMISGLAKLGRLGEAITVFGDMIRERLNPNSAIVASLLEACSVSADLRWAKWSHAITVKNGLLSHEEVGTAILNAYSKCGEIVYCQRIFDRMHDTNKSIATWSIMISAHGLNGHSREAMSLLDQMKLKGVKINSRTTVCVLSACSHGGLVEEGLSFLESMSRTHGIEPGLAHFSCAVDMLGRAGRLEAAKELIKKMASLGLEASTIKAWGSLLSACKTHRDSAIGSEAACRVIELEPLDSGGYLIGSGVYASGGSWAEVANMRRLAKERGVRVVAGASVVHGFGGVSCKFVAGDSLPHLNSGNIKSMVELLHGCTSLDEDLDFGNDE